ncbi:MAG: deoxynucleoside kinase [Acidimicrobiia bacterium]|nr:deoxynucleoside kinase [Acidimicrobiia bacterium]
MDFRYIAIEGPIAVGKTAVARRLAHRLEAATVLDGTDNPFLNDFYAGRPGAALQAQLFYLLGRHRQHVAERQANLFAQISICDCLFDRDRIYAYLNLDDNELFIYQRLFDLLARDVVPPDLVVYLQAPSEVLLQRLRDRAPAADDEGALEPDAAYVKEVNEAYQHFFFHYTATPLLVVETSHLDLGASDAAIGDLVRQIGSMSGGTRYYVPRL